MEALPVSLTPVMHASLVLFTPVMNHQNFESSPVSLQEQSAKNNLSVDITPQQCPFNIKKSNTTAVKLLTLPVSLTPVKH
jgi:hypothetical protein